MSSSSIAVIIPTLNEQASLSTVLHAAVVADVEVVVVDGGSTDTTHGIAASAGVRVLKSEPGRAAQMNAGARAVDAAVLVFCHADTVLPDGWASLVTDALADPRVAVGAFGFATDVPGASMRILEGLVWLRCHVLHRPYGDQAPFMRREVFDALDGFAPLPLMEDYDLVQRAKRIGRVRTLGAKAVTNGRMWARLGVWRMTWRNLTTVWGYRMGVAPDELARRRRR